MNVGSIYVIKNKINDKVYIGQTMMSVEDRYKQHMKPSAHKKKYKLYKAINKYGRENFYYEILESGVPVDLIDKKEIYYIELYDSFKNGYNSTPGGDGRILYKEKDIEYIVKKLKEGMLVSDLMRELGVCKETITRTLRTIGIKNSSSIQGTRVIPNLRKIDRNKILDLHLQGHKIIQISEMMNIDTKTIRRVFKDLNIQNDKPRYDYEKIPTNDFLNDVNNKLPRKDIMKKYNISTYAYYKKLKSIEEGNLNDYPEME